MNFVSSNEAPAAVGPYSPGVALNDFVFLSGQIPLTVRGELITGDIIGQAKQVFVNIDALLAAAQVNRNHIVKATIFLTNLAHFDAVNEAYADWLGDHRPARSTIQVAALPKGAEIEIEVIAATKI